MKKCWAKRIKHRPTFKDILAYLLPHLNGRFEKVSYYFSDGGGHTSDTSRGLGEEEEEEADDSSLSCEGAAAPRQTLRGGSDYGYGSPTASADGSVYDEGIDPLACMDNNGLEGYYPQPGKLYMGDSYGNGDLFNDAHNDFDVEIGDMDQPFIRNSFQEVPRVVTRQPNGPASTPQNSGLIELQPLLSAGRVDAHLGSSRPNTAQTSSHPFTAEPINHPQLYPPSAHLFHHHQQFSPQLPSPAPTIELPASQQLSQNCSPFNLADSDPLRSGPPGQHSIKTLGPPRLEGVPNPLKHGLSDPLRSGPPVSSPKGEVTGVISSPGSLPVPAKSSSPTLTAPLAKPTLRLPTLNQPPGGGFKRVPLFNTQTGRQEHKDNGSSNAEDPRHSHYLPVIDSSGHQSAIPASPSSLATTQVDHCLQTSPILSDSPHPSSLGAIASSSEGSKDSGSHSRVNGLSNGHIPMSASSSNRTTPC